MIEVFCMFAVNEQNIQIDKVFTLNILIIILIIIIIIIKVCLIFSHHLSSWSSFLTSPLDVTQCLHRGG